MKLLEQSGARPRQITLLSGIPERPENHDRYFLAKPRKIPVNFFLAVYRVGKSTVQLFGFGKQTAPTPAHDEPGAAPFADDNAGIAYFSGEQHHRQLAAAICRYLSDGRSLVLVTGSPRPDGELIADAINSGNHGTFRATVVQCHPDMDLGDLVRAYSKELGLAASATGSVSKRLGEQVRPTRSRAEPESGGLWTLLSYLTTERQNCATRVLILKDSDLIDLHCLDDLQRLAQLDQERIMPLVLLCGVTDRGATPLSDVLRSPIVGRIAVDHLEQEEVGAFIEFQLAAAGNDDAMHGLFPPRVVEAVAITSGGNAGVVNRLARKFFVASSSRDRTDKLAATPPTDNEKTEPSRTPQTGTDGGDAYFEQVEPTAVTSRAVGTPSDMPRATATEPSNCETVPTDAPAVDPGLITKTLTTALSNPSTGLDGLEAAVEARGAEVNVQNDEAPGDEPHVLFARANETETIDRNTESSGPKRPVIAFAEAVEVYGARFAGPSPTEEPRMLEPIFDPANVLGDRRAGDVSVPMKPGSMGPIMTETALVHTFERDGSPVSVEKTFTDARSAATPKQRRRGFHTGEKLARAAVVVAFSTLVLLYPSSFGGRQESVESPILTSLSHSVQTPEVRAAIPPSGATSAAGSSTKHTSSSNPLESSSTTVAPNIAATQATAEPRKGTPISGGVAALLPRIPTPVQPTAKDLGTKPSSISGNPHVEAHELKSAAAQPASSSLVAVDAAVVMVKRGEQLLAAGDIVSARRFFERIAPGGNAAAACGLAKTYDPVFLREVGARGPSGDAAAAILWYQRAIAAGSAEAVVRLNRLQGTTPSGSISRKGG